MSRIINANNTKDEEERQIVDIINNSIDKFLLEESKTTLKEIIDKQIFIDATPNTTTIEPYEAIETVLNYIDNSISKEVIKEKIGELKSEYNRIVNQTGELIDNLIDFQRISSKIEVLQELLEEK